MIGLKVMEVHQYKFVVLSFNTTRLKDDPIKKRLREPL